MSKKQSNPHPPNPACKPPPPPAPPSSRHLTERELEKELDKCVEQASRCVEQIRQNAISFGLALIPAANEIAREAHKFRSALSKLARIKYTKARKKSVTTYKKKNHVKPQQYPN